MTGALIILAVTVVAGFILYLFDRRHQKTDTPQISDPKPAADILQPRSTSEPAPLPENDGDRTSADSAPESEEASGECCGLHLVCEKELSAIARNEILYYDDEELDRFAGRRPDEYTPEETEEFRDILLTMLPTDVPGWARSLDRRNIRPPQEIRDELLMLLAEA